MYNQIVEIAPAAAVIALVAWGGINYAVASEELADRVARAHYVPECERTLEASISNSFKEAIARASRPSEAERQGSTATSFMSGIGGAYPEHMQFLDMITGGGMSYGMQALNNSARDARKAREQAVEALKQRRAEAIASATDQCSCQVKAAYNDNKTAWTLFSSTFGLIEQAGVTEFPSHMRANARMCSERVAL